MRDVTDTTIINPALIDDTIRRLRRLETTLREHGAVALNNAHAWQNTYPRPATILVTEDGQLVAEQFTAVENAATRTHQDIDTGYDRLRTDLATLDALAAQLTNDIIRNRRLTPQEARKLYNLEHDVQVTICESDTCDDIATHDNTHCDACHDYLTEHPAIRVVPRDTIATRQRVRKHRETTRGTHVDGPHAEMEAM